jgi:hypothetical protein
VKSSRLAEDAKTRSVMRFLHSETIIHIGETVEWTNHDSVTPHTITFGVVPQDFFDPSANVTVDADGAQHATISSTSDNVHSGFIASAPQERLGLAQAPLVSSHAVAGYFYETRDVPIHLRAPR